MISVEYLTPYQSFRRLVGSQARAYLNSFPVANNAANNALLHGNFKTI